MLTSKVFSAAASLLAGEEGGGEGTENHLFHGIGRSTTTLKQLAISRIRKRLAQLTNNIAGSKNGPEDERGFRKAHSMFPETSINMLSVEGELGLHGQHAQSTEPLPMEEVQATTHTPPESSDERRDEGADEMPGASQAPEDQGALLLSPRKGYGQEDPGGNRSKSPSHASESIISLNFGNQSARSSSADAGVAPAFTLKWDSFLEEILAEKTETGQRAQAIPAPSIEARDPQQASWGLLFGKDTANEAGEVLQKFTNLNVFEFHPRPAAVLDLEEDLETGEYITGARAADPLQCRVYGPGLQERIAGVLSEFFIQAVGVDGRFASHGGARFVVYVQPVEDPCRGEEGSLLPELNPPRCNVEAGTVGPQQNQFLAQVLDNEDGTYTVFFSCSVAVRHQVTILLDNKYPVASSPYVISVVPGRIDASQTIAYGSSLKHFERNGELNDFVIQARDAHGNNIRLGGDNFCVEGLGAINIVETLDFNDGLYRVKFFVRGGYEDQYCQLNVRYDGQHIQGSPFYPRPVPDPSPPQPAKERPKEYDAMYLMNPSKSLLGAMNTFWKCTEQTPDPNLPIFPPFPSNTDRDEILRKLLDQFEPAKLDLTRHQLADVRKQLWQCLHGLVEKEENLENMLGCIKRHVSAGLLHTKIEEGSKADFDKLNSSIAQIQNQLHTTYKSLQHRVADSLPVTFELEDPKEIRRIHKERRAQLLQAHSRLEAKERELRSRENKIKEGIKTYMSQLAADLKAREHALEMEQRALKINTRQVLKLTSTRLKAHARREALIACEREPVEAKKSEFWQRDFHRMLIQTPVVTAAPKATLPKAPASDVKVAPAEEAKQVETRPVDPNSFAYWLAEKQYTIKHKQLIGSLEGAAVDQGMAYRKTDLRRESPSRVTLTEWRPCDT